MTTSLRPPPPATPPPPPPPRPATASTAPFDAERTITRRPGLPGGRAVLGALLVVTAGIGTFTIARRDGGGPSGTYAVLVRAVDPGEPLTADAVAWRPMALDTEVGARSFTDRAELDGAVALVPLAPGDLVQRRDVTPGSGLEHDAPGPAVDQLAIPVPIERTPPGLRRGERITLLATYGSGRDATTLVTVQAATVLGYETDPDSIGAHDRGRLTLAFGDPTALLATAHAAQVADLTVVRTTATAARLPEQYTRDRIDGATPS